MTCPISHPYTVYEDGYASIMSLFSLNSCTLAIRAASHSSMMSVSSLHSSQNPYLPAVCRVIIIVRDVVGGDQRVC